MEEVLSGALAGWGVGTDKAGAGASSFGGRVSVKKLPQSGFGHSALQPTAFSGARIFPFWQYGQTAMNGMTQPLVYRESPFIMVKRRAFCKGQACLGCG